MNYSRELYEDMNDNDDLYSFGNHEEEQEEFEIAGGFFSSNSRSNPGFENPPPTSNPFGRAFTSSSYNMISRGSTSNPWLNIGQSEGYVPMEEIQRPMTSMNAAGYTSKPNDPLSDTFGEFGRARAQPLERKANNSPEDIAREKERQVNELLEESSIATVGKDYQLALEKAKEAVKKEKALCRFREEKCGQDQNLELSFAVQFNLGCVYQANGMYTEALDIYLLLVKNKNFAQSGRLRVNMGNIYFEQRKYSLAKQMYTMALDQIMVQNRQMRNKIISNIGITHLKTGKYDEAAEKFQEVVESNNDNPLTAFNLVLCHYARGKKEDMKQAFRILLDVKIPGLKNDEDLDDEHNSILNDELRNYLKKAQRKHYELIAKAAKLIAKVLEDNWEKGYDYVIDQCKRFEHTRERCSIVSELEMTKALNYMKHKKFSKAIESLKSFEKKDRKLQAISATNLCYLYLLEGDMKNATKYANLAVQTDKYNANALVNKGICHYLQKEYEEAKAAFIDALDSEADCIQAMYNLGLTTKAMGHYQESLAAFKKLYSIIPESIEVLYEIGSVYGKMGDTENSVKWFNMLSSRVPTDPGILYDLGTLYANENDEAQSYSSYLESFRYYPINIDVISWLGLYFVKHEIYEKALLYFERASQIQPNEVNWKLMVASCHRRIGAFQQAKKCYEQIHIKYPENIECLRYLVQICTELGLKKERKHYAKQLAEIEESQRQKKNEDKGDDKEFTNTMAEDDTMKKTMEQVAQQKELLMNQKKEEEIRQKEQEELKRLRAIEEEYLALKKASMAKPGKKGVTFAETEEMIHRNIVNDKLVENIEDEFMHIDDGIDSLYS